MDAWMHGYIDTRMHDYLRVVCVVGQRGQSWIAGLGSYSASIQSYREEGGKRAYEYREGFHDDDDDDDDDDETTQCLTVISSYGHKQHDTA
jgi:hypothetical protein